MGRTNIYLVGKMKILLSGKNGQAGWELPRSLAPLGEVLALDRYSSSHCSDLSQPDELVKTVLAFKRSTDQFTHVHCQAAASLWVGAATLAAGLRQNAG
jgi:dTDP-4-dehydrorhamnose reductase